MAKDERAGREPSDLFAVETSNSSIPPVEEIVLPKEEATRQQLRKVALLALAGVLVAVAAFALARWVGAMQTRAALQEATDRGSPEDFQVALERVQDESPSIRARLLATAALEQGAATLTEAEAVVAEAPDADDADMRLAKAYIAIAKGETKTAEAELAKPGTYDDQAAEFMRARSVLAATRGKWNDALADAKTAVEIQPSSVRLAAMEAWAASQAGNTDAAVAALEAAGNAPVSRVALGRLIAFGRGDLTRAGTLAAKVLQDPAATERQKAWAHTIAGLQAFTAGQLTRAREASAAAAAEPFAWDELLTLRRAQLAMVAGDTETAKRTLALLPEGPSADPALRALTLAWRYANADEQRRAVATLKGAGIGPRAKHQTGFQAFSLARSLAGSHRVADRKRARALYASAAAHPVWQVPAALHEATMHLRQGDPVAAVSALDPALMAHPHHPRLVGLKARALLTSDNAEAANMITQQATEGLPDEAWSHGVRGQTLVALGRAADAIPSLARAVELDAKDARLHAWLGHAQRENGNVTAAAKAFERALGQDAKDPLALAGMLTIHNDRRDAERAADVAKRLNEAGIHTLAADQQRARLSVLQGAGLAGTKGVRESTTRHPKDPVLRSHLGRLYMQSGEFTNAAQQFERAKRLGSEPVTADLRAAMAYGAAKRPRAVEARLDAAKENGGATTEAQKVWALVAKARLMLATNRGGYAFQLAKQADERLPNDGDVLLLRADTAEDRNRNSVEYLVAAANAPIPMPVAAGRAAVQLGATEQGCMLGRRYLSASKRGKLASDVRAMSKACN